MKNKSTILKDTDIEVPEANFSHLAFGYERKFWNNLA